MTRPPPAERHLAAVLDVWADRGERSRCRLSGNSMAPLIRDGDLVTIEHGRRRARLGDVLVFDRAGRRTAHRLVWRRREAAGAPVYLTKGDASPAFDGPVPAALVLGRVIEVRGRAGTRRLATPFWTLAAPVAAGLSLLHGALAAGWRARRRVARKLRSLL